MARPLSGEELAQARKDLAEAELIGEGEVVKGIKYVVQKTKAGKLLLSAKDAKIGSIYSIQEIEEKEIDEWI